MSEEIVWKDPPEKKWARSTPGIWKRRLTPLLERPNTWAMVKICPTRSTADTTVQCLRRGSFVAPEGNWEFRAFTTNDTAGEVYARYLGPKEEKSNG